MNNKALVVGVLCALASVSCGNDSSSSPAAPSTPTRVINLSGTLAFGTVQIGSSATQTFTIGNTGNSPLAFTGMTLPASLVSAFTGSPTSGTIQPGGSQTITVRFTPTAAIDYNADLTVNGDQTSGSNRIGVTGRGDGLVSLTGVVSSTANNAGIPSATVRILDCGQVGRTATTDGFGNYRIDGLTPNGCNISASATGYETQILGVGINGQNTLNFRLQPPPFTRSGVGDNVFQLPGNVTRVRVDATYGGSCQNFVVRANNSLLINIIIGTCSVADTRSPFTGTYIVPAAATISIVSSTGINWTFTEVRN